VEAEPKGLETLAERAAVETEFCRYMPVHAPVGLLLARGTLEIVQEFLDIVDEEVGGAEIDGPRPAAVAIRQAIIGPVGSAVSAAIGGHDGALRGEEPGIGADKKQGGMQGGVARLEMDLGRGQDGLAVVLVVGSGHCRARGLTGVFDGFPALACASG